MNGYQPFVPEPDRLEIAKAILAGIVTNPGSCANHELAASSALNIADTLIALHEKTAQPKSAFAVRVRPDAPTTEWKITVKLHNTITGMKYCARAESANSAPTVCGDYYNDKDSALADLPAVYAAATAYSASEGRRVVFTGTVDEDE